MSLTQWSIQQLKILTNPTKLNLFLDILLTLAFVVEMEYHFIGLRIHELLGLSFGVAILVHLVLHWNWIVSIGKHFFRMLLHESRFNFSLNVLLFIDAVVMIVSGILISKTLGLNLTNVRASGFPWQQIHILSSQLSLLIVALHVAVHWKWIATHSKKYLFAWPRRKVQSAVVLQASSQEG